MSLSYDFNTIMHSPNRVPILTSRPQGESPAPLRHPPCEQAKALKRKHLTSLGLSFVDIYIYTNQNQFMVFITHTIQNHSFLS